MCCREVGGWGVDASLAPDRVEGLPKRRHLSYPINSIPLTWPSSLQRVLPLSLFLLPSRSFSPTNRNHHHHHHRRHLHRQGGGGEMMLRPWRAFMDWVTPKSFKTLRDGCRLPNILSGGTCPPVSYVPYPRKISISLTMIFFPVGVCRLQDFELYLAYRVRHTKTAADSSPLI